MLTSTSQISPSLARCRDTKTSLPCRRIFSTRAATSTLESSTSNSENVLSNQFLAAVSGPLQIGVVDIGDRPRSVTGPEAVVHRRDNRAVAAELLFQFALRLLLFRDVDRHRADCGDLTAVPLDRKLDQNSVSKNRSPRTTRTSRVTTSPVSITLLSAASRLSTSSEAGKNSRAVFPRISDALTPNHSS